MNAMPINLFYSYAHEDEELRKELEKHLTLLQREGTLHQWHDRKIIAGQEWADEIDQNLESAQIILLLISADFIFSEYCYNNEMKRAIERHTAGEARVIPVIIRSVDWSGAPFGKLQALPTDGKPVKSWPDRDEAWTDVTKGIRIVAEKIRASFSKTQETSSRRDWHVPYPKNPFFTGRTTVLARLKNAIDQYAIAALSGMGGIGKTETIIEYAYQHRDEYQTVLWTRADTRETLMSGFAAIAAGLNLPEKEAQDQSLAVMAVKRWLEDHTEWLLVLDNADDLTLVQDFLPQPRKGHVLLTTRAQATGEIPRIELEEMLPEEGALFLLHRAKILDYDAPLEQAIHEYRKTAEEISKVLDGLPLALDQAGAFIEETPSSLEEYLQLFTSEGKTLRAERGEFARDHPSVTITFSLAFKQVQANNPAAADMIRVCAFLAPDAIPEEIFSTGANHWEAPLGPATANPLLLTKAIKEAGRYSLIKRQPDSKTLDIHRLVQEVVRDEMDAAERCRWIELTVRAMGLAFPGVQFSNWPICERLLPHAQACADHLERWGLEFPEATRLLNQTGVYLYERARYSEAGPLYQRSLAIWEKALGLDHRYVATSLNNLAELYRAQGAYAKAEPLYQRSLAIRDKALGPDHPDVATSLLNYAGLLRKLDRVVEAEAMEARAKAIQTPVTSQQPGNQTDTVGGESNY